MANCLNLIIFCRKPARKVTLTILGLDNAGKTATVRSIKGENPEDVTPTVGFSVVNLIQGQFDMSIFDLGGAGRIRDIWKHYFSESHAVVYVVDSSDVQRMQETKDVLARVLGHPRVAGKPVLLLANKQDIDGALHEADVIDRLSLEELVNQHQCRCKIVPCSAVQAVGKKAIRSGLEWLLKTVAMNYDIISERVQKDTAEQREQEAAEKRERAERVRRVREEREKREREEAELEGRTAEEEEDEGIMANPFQPIRDVISEIGGKQRKEPEDEVQTAERTDPDRTPERTGKVWLWRKITVEPPMADFVVSRQSAAPSQVVVWEVQARLRGSSVSPLERLDPRPPSTAPCQREPLRASGGHAPTVTRSAPLIRSFAPAASHGHGVRTVRVAMVCPLRRPVLWAGFVFHEGSRGSPFMNRN